MIELINVKKKFGSRLITNGVNLKISPGQTTCIIGKSGEGKSVLLKQIIGLIRPTSGTILFDGTDITQLDNTHMSTIFNKCGYVFQFAALMDSLTVYENIALSLLEQNIPRETIQQIILKKLALVHLSTDILSKYPAELSGGMRKRVGLARTLVKDPTVILYDEPTTGLDPISCRMVHELIQSLQYQCNVTSIVVSHDIEIFKYVDNIALLHEGKIHYMGPAQTIWQSDNPYVYQFIRGLSEGPLSD